MSKTPSTPAPRRESRGKTYDVFISYSANDAHVAGELAKHLQGEGLRVFFDRAEIKPGEQWRQRIREALDHSSVCLVLLSGEALPSKPHLSQEWSAIQEFAWRRRDLSLCPVMLDSNARTPPFLRTWKPCFLDKDAADATEFQRALKDVVLIVLRGDYGRDPLPAEASWLDRVARFDEIEKALSAGVGGDQQKEDRDDD